VLCFSRTEGEFSAGHPQGAVNIPFMYKTGSGITALSCDKQPAQVPALKFILRKSPCMTSSLWRTLYEIHISILAFLLLGMTNNTQFLEQVSREFSKDDEIIVVRLLNIHSISFSFSFQYFLIHLLSPGMPKWQEIYQCSN
jgi:hypothetical protein